MGGWAHIVTFQELIKNASKYDGQRVRVQGYYQSGFEYSLFAEKIVRDNINRKPRLSKPTINILFTYDAYNSDIFNKGTWGVFNEYSKMDVVGTFSYEPGPVHGYRKYKLVVEKVLDASYKEWLIAFREYASDDLRITWKWEDKIKEGTFMKEYHEYEKMLRRFARNEDNQFFPLFKKHLKNLRKYLEYINKPKAPGLPVEAW